MLEDSTLVLTENSTFYRQEQRTEAETNSCVNSCPTELLSLTNETVLDFHWSPEIEVLFWSGSSSCQEEGIFSLRQIEANFEAELDSSGCPQTIVDHVFHPSLHIASQVQLYFSSNNEIQYIYGVQEENRIRWESSSLLRSIQLEWSDSTPVNLDDISLLDFQIFSSTEKILFLGYRPTAISTDQYQALSYAVLLNP